MSENEKWKEKEVVVSRNEMFNVFGQAYAIMAAKMNKEQRECFKEMQSTFAALVMVQLFDQEEVDKLEIE